MFSESWASKNAKIVMARLSRFKADILTGKLAKKAHNGIVGCQVKDIFEPEKEALMDFLLYLCRPSMGSETDQKLGVIRQSIARGRDTQLEVKCSLNFNPDLETWLAMQLGEFARKEEVKKRPRAHEQQSPADDEETEHLGTDQTSARRKTGGVSFGTPRVPVGTPRVSVVTPSVSTFPELCAKPQSAVPICTGGGRHTASRG